MPGAAKTERPRAWLGEVVALLGIAAVAAVKFWPLLIPGTRQFLGGDFSLSVEPYFYHLLKEGTVPLWDPTLGTGSPFLGGGTHRPMPLQAHLHLFYPLNLLGLGLAERNGFIPHGVLTYHLLFHFVLGGGFSYAYGRVLGLSRFPAFVSAVAFMFSGFMLAHAGHWTIIDTIVWLPLILACLVRAEATERARWGALAGLFLGVAFLAGHAQIFYYVSLATTALGLTLLGRRLVSRRPWRRLLAVLLLAPPVAVGLAAVQLVPSWSMAVGSYRAGLGYDWKSMGSLSPSWLLQVLLRWGLLSVGDWRFFASESYLYPGILVVVLAGYALSRRGDWRHGFHAILGLAAILLAFGRHFPLHRMAFEILPGLSLFRIPARILGLASFAVAVLAGLGAQAFLAERAHRGLLTFVKWTGGLLAAASVPGYLLLRSSVGQPSAQPVQALVDEYVLLLILVALILAVVAGQTRGWTPFAVKGGILAVLVLDLGFGSSTLSDGSPNPDRRSVAERELTAFLHAQPGPFRASLLTRIHPGSIYRNGWGVFDDESGFAPKPFLDLYGLRETNPRIFDLLNVKYLVDSAWLPPPQPVDRFNLWPGSSRRVVVPSRTTVGRIELATHLIYGLAVPQGEAVAVVRAVGTDGVTREFGLRAGEETAEWAVDKPGARAAHQRATVVRSWPVPNKPYQGHTYRAVLKLPAGFRLAELIFQHRTSTAVLVVEEIRLDGREPAPPLDRLTSVRPDLYENRLALPRAFLVRRARQVSPRRILEEMASLDPAEEVLLTEPLPDGWPPSAGLADGPLPPVRIVEYTPHRVQLETEIAEPLFLLLSDTYHAGWHAWDNGRTVPVLRANHALRAVALTPGRHRVEFRYHQPSFWIGLWISLGTLGTLGGAGLVAWWRCGRHARG